METVLLVFGLHFKNVIKLIEPKHSLLKLFYFPPVNLAPTICGMEFVGPWA